MLLGEMCLELRQVAAYTGVLCPEGIDAPKNLTW